MTFHVFVIFFDKQHFEKSVKANVLMFVVVTLGSCARPKFPESSFADESASWNGTHLYYGLWGRGKNATRVQTTSLESRSRGDKNVIEERLGEEGCGEEWFGRAGGRVEETGEHVHVDCFILDDYI